MIEGPKERYQIATSEFHCILSGSLNEAAYNTYSTGVIEISIAAQIAGSSYLQPQLLFDQFFFFLTLDRTLGFFIFQTTTSGFVLEDFLFVQPN